MKDLGNKIGNVLNNRSAFKICCILSAYFSLIAYIDIVFYSVTFFIYIWGIYLTAANYIKGAAFKKVEYSKLIVAMVVLFAATAVANIFSSPVSTAITIGTAAINIVYFYLFFCDYERDMNIIRKEIYILSRLIAIITAVCALVGLILLAVFHRAIWIGERSLIIFENRFKGIYINPNPMAFASVTGIIACLILRCRGFLLKINKKPIRLRWMCICCGLNMLSLMLSVSNSGMLLMCCFMFGIVCYLIFAGWDAKCFKAVALRTVAFIVSCAVILCCLVASRRLINYVSGIVISGDSVVSSDILLPTREQYTSELQTEDGSVTFEHINTTFDSGRLKLYNKALSTIIQAPVFGVGYGNILYNGWLKTGKLFDFHNGYLTLAASNGLALLIVFIIFGLLLAKRMTTVVFKLKLQNSKSVLPVLMCFIYAYCIYACVEPTMLFYPSYQVTCFWWMLGCAFALIRDFEHSFKS